MQKWHVVIAALGVVVIATAADNPPSKEIPFKDVGERVVIIGRLGNPIGKAITIHGRSTKPAKGEICIFVVDSVDGEKSERTSIEIPGLEHWPENTQATLRGYEEGTIAYSSPYDGGLPHDAVSTFVRRQVIYVHFKVQQVLDPPGLTVGPEGQGRP